MRGGGEESAPLAVLDSKKPDMFRVKLRWIGTFRKTSSENRQSLHIAKREIGTFRKTSSENRQSLHIAKREMGGFFTKTRP